MFAAAARVDTGFIYYLGLAVVVAITVFTLIALYRTWNEIHEDVEPDSPEDLFESLREAHAAGQIDDRELERVRQVLAADRVDGAVTGSPARYAGKASQVGEETAGPPAPDALEP